MVESMLRSPEEIYLTNDLGEINWCQDRITDDDVKYIHEDKFAKAIQQERDKVCDHLDTPYRRKLKEIDELRSALREARDWIEVIAPDSKQACEFLAKLKPLVRDE